MNKILVVDDEKEIATLETDRAWIEINLENLEHNINEIKKIIHSKTKIMAIVKANAYGHGLVLIAKKLSEIGINDFAVATLDEAINLRKNNINGNILILGFTNFENLKYVIKYDLIQTIVDYNYSEKIKELNLNDKLKCHVKINTGMNRIGEKYDNIDELSKIYENDKLNILGTFSHLCVSDSEKEEDIEFSKMQVKRFDECVRVLKDKGYNTGLLHIQSSYGIINYTELNYDYVRPGIIMYGVNSTKDSYQKNILDLKPVLSVKTRITSIRQIDTNESVSYGRTYIANGKRRVAAISIGYADGIPRNLSNKDVVVLVKGNYAPVIGRICMEQIIIDVTNIHSLEVGDVVTVIGEDEKVSAEELSYKADTITNEILCRLENRLNRVVVK